MTTIGKKVRSLVPVAYQDYATASTQKLISFPGRALAGIDILSLIRQNVGTWSPHPLSDERGYARILENELVKAFNALGRAWQPDPIPAVA